MRCLLVDDNSAFLVAASGLLRSQGGEVVGCALSGEEAARLVEVSSPDVALVDVQLGGENGIELARRLAAKLPVVLISTRSEDEVAEFVADSRAVGFISKRRLGAAEIAALLPGSA